MQGNITVKELEHKKSMLEDKIMSLCNEFYKDTGVMINNIDMTVEMRQVDFGGKVEFVLQYSGGVKVRL